MIKNSPSKARDAIQSLGWEDPLEEEVATHSSMLAWRIPWTGEPARLESMGSQRVRKGDSTENVEKRDDKR